MTVGDINVGPASIVPVTDQDGDAKPCATPPDDRDGWWSRYRAKVSDRLSTAALTVLESDARYIAERVLPRSNGALDEAAWPDTRVRTGMVVGSVQSGKTANMLGVAAMTLDAGADLLILLAGTRVSLWLQTYERLLSQLDGSTSEDAFRNRARRVILPEPADILNDQRADPARYLQRPVARRALRAGRPIIIVVPKEDDHLIALRRFVADVLPPKVLDARDRAFSIVLLDDEADDASVLDSELSQKLTPRLISSIWSGDDTEAATRHPRMLATYVAYTATPQANYLQATHNPLNPRDFNAALRTPGDSGAIQRRSLTYTEAVGVGRYYCGGDMFYERLRQAGGGAFCQTWPFPELAPGETEAELAKRRAGLRWNMLSDALRCFLVGAAVRSLQPGWESVYDHQRRYPSREGAQGAAQGPCTMLIHPSARKEDHFSTALDILRWAQAKPGTEADFRLVMEPEDISRPPVDALVKRLGLEEEKWARWLERFEATRIGLASLPNTPYRPISSALWPQVREALVNRVFPNLRIRVLNSDPASDDRPRFDVGEDGRGFHVPPDSLSIFVAGNVLSRGLTLEGLTTSLFMRGAAEPAADTQMQMQRWFGYRGPQLPYCRVFTYEDQLDLFRRYHVNDSALKSELIAGMDGDPSRSDPALVLQGTNFLATSKVEARKVPLSPGPRPSIRIVESGNDKLARHNIQLAVDLLAEGRWVPLTDDKGLERGIIRTEPVSARRLADLLDGLRFSHHDPNINSELSQRWEHYRRQLKIAEPLFLPPDINPQPYQTDPQSCPYSIAAYLRLWTALSGRHIAPGFYPTDRPDTPWNYRDTKSTRAPEFYIAFRHGDAKVRDPRLEARGIRAVTRALNSSGTALQTLWGTRGYGNTYYGDELVDYYHHRTLPVPGIQGGASWRPRGHPGLALLHVVTAPDFATDFLSIGLGLPHGGPDHIAALKT